MFEDLKKEHAAGLGSKERARLTMFVVACLMLGVMLVGLQSCYEVNDRLEAEEGSTDPETPLSSTPIELDPARLAELGERAVGDGERVEILEEYAPALVTHLRGTVEGEPPPGERLTPTELAARPREAALGRVFDVEGVVVARTEHVFERETQRLWSLVIQDEQGGQVVAVRHGLRADPGAGQPVDDYRGRGSRRPVYVGQYVLVRGYYMQRRTGTIGETQLPQPTPVLWATNFRQRLEPADRVPPVASLDAIDWSLIRDRFYAETKAWDEPQLYQTLQWARAQGPDRIRELIRSGELEVGHWDQDAFARWQPEVDVRDGAERPFTAGSRGKWFKTSGLIASHVYEGWNTIAANKWGVDSFTVLDLYSDHYANTNIRNISAFPLDSYPEVQGERKEHVWIYGVFYKNHTFLTKRGRQNKQGAQDLTMPMFIVMHVEPVTYDLSDGRYQGFMWIVAGSIVLLGLIFWLVFVRGETKEAARLEQHRIRLRQRMRARRQAAESAEAGDDDAPPAEEA